MEGNNNIPKHWQEKSLGEIFTIERGGSPRPIEEYITNDENGINWIKIGDTKNVVKYISHTKEKIKPDGAKRSRMVYEDDFLLSNSMSFGRPYIMKTTGCIHDGWLVIRKNETIDNNYLYYILSSSFLFQQFSNLAKGSTVKNLNIEAVKQAVIRFPPLPEQQAIVSKIEELFSQLENGKQHLLTVQQQLKVYRQSLLKAAFEGKLTAQWRQQQINNDYSIAAEPQTEYEKKDELPVGWKWSSIGDICNMKAGFFVKADNIEKKNKEGLFPCYGGNGLRGFTNSFTHKGKYLLVGRQGALCGNVHRVNGVFHATEHAVVTSPKEGINTDWLFYKLTAMKLNQYSAGAAQPGLSVNKLLKIKISFPPIEEQQLIVSELESKLTVCDKIEETISQSLQQAETLRQSILKKAFSGELVIYHEDHITKQ